MIRFITGIPGSGKTYFAVWEITKRFYTYNKELFLYVPKDKYKDLVVFSNIDNLKLKHINLDYYLETHNLDIKKFFTVDYQRQLQKRYRNIVYLIDEVQRFFDKKFYDKDVFFLFQYHRHLGLDFYLITQDKKLVAPQIVSLIEYEIVAVRRTNRLSNVFKYHYVANGDIIGKKTIPLSNKIFTLYKSFDVDETIRNNPQPLKKYVIQFCILLVIVMCAFGWFVSRWSRAKVAHDKNIQKDVNVKVNNGDINAQKKMHNKVVHVDKYKVADSVVSSVSVNVHDSVSGGSYDVASVGHFFRQSSHVWVPLGYLQGTGVLTVKGSVLGLIVMGRVYTVQDCPYPIAKREDKYWVLVPVKDLNLAQLSDIRSYQSLPLTLQKDLPSLMQVKASSNTSLPMSTNSSQFGLRRSYLDYSPKEKRIIRSYLSGDPYYRLAEHY